MQGAGVDAGSVLAEGYIVSELKSADFTASQMSNAHCSVQQLNGCFTLVELKATYDMQSLRLVYSVSDMEGSGFGHGASCLTAVGCGAKELKHAGFIALESKNVGFDLVALYAAGFNVDDLNSANFTDADIALTATFASAEAAMRRARVHVAAVLSLGASEALTR